MLILHALQRLFTVGSSNAITFELALKRYNLMCYKPRLKKILLSNILLPQSLPHLKWAD